jgi:hypothetical protein
MSGLTIEQLEEKIKHVDRDLDLQRQQGDASRKLEILSQYREYLEEELKELRSGSNNS